MTTLTKNTFVEYSQPTSKTIGLSWKVIVANLIRQAGNYNLKFETQVNADIDLRVLIVIDKGKNQRVNVEGVLKSSHSKINLHIIALILEGELVLDGWIFIPPKVEKVEGYLLEENVILGENIKITSLPRLDVRSNDVAASHGARIERLDELKMFYLRSKWLNKKQAQLLLINGYIQKFFEWLDDIDKIKADLISYFQKNL